MRGGGGAVGALELLHGLAVPARVVDFDKRAVDRDLGNLQAAAGKGRLVDAPRLRAAVQRRPPEATPLEAVAERIEATSAPLPASTSDSGSNVASGPSEWSWKISRWFDGVLP